MPTLDTYSRMTIEPATGRATTEGVRTFAGPEVAGQMAIAAAFGAADAAPIMTEAQSVKLEELRATEDAGFEVAHLDGQIAAHEEGLGIVRSYAETGTDATAQGAAMIVVPAIESISSCCATCAPRWADIWYGPPGDRRPVWRFRSRP